MVVERGWIAVDRMRTGNQSKVLEARAGTAFESEDDDEALLY